MRGRMLYGPKTHKNRIVVQPEAEPAGLMMKAVPTRLVQRAPDVIERV